MKKTLLIAVFLIIVGLFIMLFANSMGMQANKENGVEFFQLKNSQAPNMQFTEAKNIAQLEKKQSFSDCSLSSEPIAFGLYPSVASQDEKVVVGYQYFGLSPSFFSSSDGGKTWSDEQVSFGFLFAPISTDLDSCGDNRFLGGMVPFIIPYNQSEIYKVMIDDVSDFEDGYRAVYWVYEDLGAGFYNFTDISVAGYNSGDAEEDAWAYGGHSIVGVNGEEPNNVSCLFHYQCKDTGEAWMYYWDSISGCEQTAHDIDQETLKSYAIWNFDNTEDKDIFVNIMNFGKWEASGVGNLKIHPIINNGVIETTGNDNYIDISAFDDNVIIVSEREGDIACYYSTDGFDNIAVTTIETGGFCPSIKHFGEKIAMCTFTKDDGKLYYTYTFDGGKTWEEVKQLTSSQNVEQFPNHYELSKAGLAWLDYDEALIHFSRPDLNVTSFSGGLKINSEITNKGDLPALNVDYKLNIEGGMLNRIYKSVNKTIEILNPDDIASIETNPFFGFGKIKATVSAGSSIFTKEGRHWLFFSTFLK